MPAEKPVSSFAPYTVITLATLIAASLAILSVIFVMRAPWLGVQLKRDYAGAGIQVEQLMPDSPAAGRLQAGDVMTEMAAGSARRVGLSPLLSLEDPDQLSSYDRYNEFFALQQAAFEILASPSFAVRLEDGRQIVLHAAAYPSPLVIPAAFWWLIFFGGASFLFGVSAWSMRPHESVTRVLAISGAGYMAGAYACAIYMAREIALPADTFRALAALNHLGIMVFAYSAILFFWYYPKRLGRAPAAWLLAGGAGLLWLNETLQWWSWPAHVFYAHFVVAYALLLLFTFLQWRNCRGDPLLRTMLKWMLVTTLLSLGFTIALFYAPLILVGHSIASTVMTFGAVFGLYLGLVIGNIRYQQFDMEHWWFVAWKWLVFVLIALISDVMFVYFLKLHQDISVGLSLAIGALYLFARQWLWSRLSGNGGNAFDRALPHLVDTMIFRQKGVTPDQQWRQLIERIFNPLTFKVVQEDSDSVSIGQGGLFMHLPALDGAATFQLFCCEQGKRLFRAADVHMANRLLELMRYAREQAGAHAQGVLEERQRIQRDLHDDVAARLLSLIHQSREPAISKAASSAMKGLRDVIYLLGAEEALLEDVMSDLESIAREQLAGLPVTLEWQVPPGNWPEVKLSSQQHINLRRILRETLANALKHAQSHAFVVYAAYADHSLLMRICGDNRSADPASWVPGRGLNNIRSRVGEVGGSHKWVIAEEADCRRYCCLELSLPLSHATKPAAHPAD